MKKITKQCSLILILMFCFFCIFSQSLQKTRKGYSIDGEEYRSKSEIFELLENSPEAKEAYKKSIHYKKQSIVMGSLSLAGMGTVFLLINNPGRQQGGGLNLGRSMLIGFTAIISALFGTLYMKTSSASKQKKEEVVDLYNNKIIGYMNSAPLNKINIGLNNNGVGIHYTF